MDDLSSKRLDEMMRKGLVKNIPDLYKLKKEQLLTLEKVKEKLADKFINTINQSKTVDIITFLSALGLTGGAYNKCEKVVYAGYDTIPKLKKLTVDELSLVESFAEKSSTDFLSSFREKTPIIDKLLKLGFSFEEKKKSNSKLSGMKICIHRITEREKVSDRDKKLEMLVEILSVRSPKTQISC